ncbi:MAG: hypothetical protein AAF950_02915 [Pseudomonadota bacterium]
MPAKPDDRLYRIARDVLLRILLKDTELHERLDDPDYRQTFRLKLGDALHNRYDFSDTLQSPEAVAEDILDAIVDIIKAYRDN